MNVLLNTRSFRLFTSVEVRFKLLKNFFKSVGTKFFKIKRHILNKNGRKGVQGGHHGFDTLTFFLFRGGCSFQITLWITLFKSVCGLLFSNQSAHDYGVHLALETRTNSTKERHQN